MVLSLDFSGISNINLKLDDLLNLKYNASSNYDLSAKTFSSFNFSGLSEIKVKTNSSIIINFNSFSSYDLSAVVSLNIDFIGISNLEIGLSRVGLNELLLVLSPDLELLAYLESYNDFVWNRRWRKVDDFEVSIHRNREESKYLRPDCYIALKNGDVIHAGRIKDREIKKSDNNELITVSGKGLGEIFEERIAFHNVNTGDGYDSFSGPAESAMKHYVDVNVVNPDNPARKVNQLEIYKDLAKGNNINYNARFQKISEILYEISKTTGLGWDLQLDIDSKKFIFKVLTAGIKDEIRLNPAMDSVKMIDFKESKSSSENTILIAGQGSGADRQMLEVSRNEV
jgi:hypothetical protein